MAKSSEHQLTLQDLADILAGTLRLLREHNLRVGLRQTPDDGLWPGGVLVYVERLALDETGRLTAAPALDPAGAPNSAQDPRSAPHDG